MTNLYQRLNALSPEQKALLQKRLQNKGINVTNSQTIPVRQQEEQIPLSFIQERLWFLHQLQPDLPVYNESILWRIEGELNHELLIASVNKLIQRHEILRTNFKLIDNEITTIINPELKLDIPLVNINDLSNQQPSLLPIASLGGRSLATYVVAGFHRYSLFPILKETANQPFNLSQGALIRGIIVKINPEEYLLLLVMHHIIYDGWSSKILLQELTSFYNNCSNLSPLPIQYADFAQWQRQSFTQKKRLKQLNYWKKQLANPPSLLNLPTDYSRPTRSSFRGQKSFLKLSPQLSQGLKSLSQTEGVTLFMLLLTAFNILLHRHSADTDILVGTPISQRQQPETEALIGCFLNTLVLRTKFRENSTFRELLTQVRATTLEAYNYSDLPFSELVQELQPNRSLNHSPLFQVMFVFQDSPLGKIATSDLTLTPEIFDSGISKFDISVFLENTPEGIMGVWEYSSDLFKPKTIDRMLQHFQILLEGIVTYPEASINTLPLLTETEKQQLHHWNQTQADFPEQCLHQLFEKQVAKTPDAIISYQSSVISYQLTYKELNEKADRLAAYLQQQGVKPEVLVGIYLESSLNLIIALLAIMKAGGAYLPLDPNYPSERLNFILEDAQPLLILTESTLKLKLQNQKSKIICIENIDKNIENISPTPDTRHPTPHSLAYVIYTSGSTGKPKGVEITQRSLVNFLTSMKHFLEITSKDVWLSVTTITFDIAALEIYLPLITGATLVLANREITGDGIKLGELIANSQATFMQATPSTWRMLLTTQWQGFSQLNILCGGEALSQTLAKELLSRGKSLWNLYGPTETTIWSTINQIQPEDEVISVGKPIANTEIYICDKFQQLVPIGVPGELYIGGVGVARGYLNRPELTQERFIPPLFPPNPPYQEGLVRGSKLYKTGDLARYLPDGKLQLLGRIDHQVKIRGFRIELGEIEAVLSQHPLIESCVVTLIESEGDDRSLSAYVVAKAEGKPTITEINQILADKFPQAMIPATYSFLEALPLLTNGKINRQALPKPDLSRPQLEVAYIMPRSQLEKTLASIWQKTLNLEEVGINDNFFELGGHSLLMVQLHRQICEEFTVEFPLMEMFKHSTINLLTKLIEKTKTNKKEGDTNEPINDKITAGKQRRNQAFLQRQKSKK